MFVPEATWEEYEERKRREREQAAPVDTAWRRATELMMQPSRGLPEIGASQPIGGRTATSVLPMGTFTGAPERVPEPGPFRISVPDEPTPRQPIPTIDMPLARPRLPEIQASQAGYDPVRMDQSVPSIREAYGRAFQTAGDVETGLNQLASEVAGKNALLNAEGRLVPPTMSEDWTQLIERGREAEARGEGQLPLGTALSFLGPGEVRAGIGAAKKVVATPAVRTVARAVNEAVTSPALRRVAPGLGVEAAETPAKRFYHGTGTAFDVPDAAKFDPNGLYGPGYYVTDSPEVAGSYAATRANAGDWQGAISGLQKQADYARKQLGQVTNPEQRKALEQGIALIQEQIDKFGPTGSNIRAISVPENMKLYPANDMPVGEEIITTIANALPEGQKVSFAIRADNARWEHPQGVLTGERAYQLLTDVANSKAKANTTLQTAGFDGLQYPGGRHMPLLDTEGRAIQHDALVVFPESLPKIKNAISGLPMGSPPEIGGAIVGGIAYQDDPNLSPEENLARRAAFAAGGYGLGYGARKLGSKSRLGGTIEDASKPPLGQMYAERPSSFNVGETVRSIGNTWERGRRAVVRAFTDADVDVAKFQQQAAKTAGRPLNADEMLYELKRLNVDKAAEVNLQENLRPILREIGDDRNWLSEYLTYQDNIDVAKAMNNPSRKFSGNLTADDSAARLIQMKDALGPERMQKVEQTATQVQAFNRQLLQRKVDAGVITQELADDLTQKYPHYSPTRITDYLQEPTNISRGKSLSVRDSGLRRNTVKGTTREREDPLASIVRNAYQTEALARKNQAFQAFVKLRDMSDEAVKSSIRPVADTYAPIRGEAKVTGFVDGVRQTYVVPKALEQVIKNEPKAVIPGFAGAIWGGMMNLFRMGATSRNPVFLASNAFLDAGAYTIRETTRAGGPQHLPTVLLELGKAYGNAFQGIFSSTYRGQTAEFLKGGGGMFGYFQGSPKAAKKGVQELARGNVFSVNSASDLGRLAKDLVTLRPVEGIGERIELAPRVASFNLAQGRGSNQVRAVVNGRTVTMDFAQGGNVSKVINQFVPFFNVGMQSPVQAWRAFKENPKAFLATTATLLAGPTVAAEAWNRSDSQRAKDYDDVPQYLKDQGIVIMLPVEAAVDAQGNRKPQFVHLRMREYAPFVVLTREAIQKAMGDNPRDWWDLTQGGLGSVSPIQGNTPADTLAAFTPLGVSTGLQLASNQDYFRNRMIATKSGDERASEISKQIAGATGTRPSQVEFAVRDLASGVGGAGLAAGDLIAGKSKGNTPQDAPVVGGAYGRFVRGNTGQRLDEARRNLLQPETQKQLKKAGAELNLGIVGNSIDGIPLRQAEQERYQVLANEYTNIYVRKAFNLPNWERYSPEQRTEIVKDLASKAREAAGNVVLSEMGKEERKRRLLQEAG